MTDRVDLLGRAFAAPDGRIWLGLPGTGAEFEFTGSRLSITMAGNCSLSDKLSRIAVYVDGKRISDICLTNRKQIVEISTKTDKSVNVRIVKLSECLWSCCVIVSIDAHGGKVQRCVQTERKIEFIGDSMTCGYGVDDPDAAHGFSTRSQDCTKGFAVKTAELLCAQYSLVAFSGYGVVSGYTNQGSKEPDTTVAKYYEKYGFTESTGFNGQAPDELDWDFSRFIPDVVVINLGTNDLSYTGESAARRREFIQGYVRLLKQVRSKNSKARLICALGTMGTALNDEMIKAVRQYSEQTGDRNIDAVRLKQQNTEVDGVTVDFHPSEKTYIKIAKQLSEKIKADMDW